MEGKQPVITIRCTPELHLALKQLAFDNHISMNLFICELLIKECNKAGFLKENHETPDLRTPLRDNPHVEHPNGQADTQTTNSEKTH